MGTEGLDELDNAILKCIRNRARMSFTDIGERVGLSRVAVKARMEAMELKGIIRGYETIIDEKKAVSGTKFFLDVEAYPEHFESVTELLMAEKTIQEIYTVSGDCRIHAVGYASNPHNLQIFVNGLYKNARGVRKLGCHTVLSTLKEADGGTNHENNGNGEEQGTL